MRRNKLFRMELHDAPMRATLPPQIKVVPYSRAGHHDAIRRIYSEAFDENPWPANWDVFEEFDAKGVFLAVHTPSAKPVGYVISFRRGDFGYISVVAVLSAFRHQGIASGLLQAAIEYLRSLNLNTVKVDVYVTNTSAVEAYKKTGFQVVEIFESNHNQRVGGLPARQ